MPTRWTPDTRPDFQIDFDDNGDIYAVSKNSVSVSVGQGTAVLAENQAKNHAMDRLRIAGIIVEQTDSNGDMFWDERPFWEMKGNKVNVKVPPEKKNEVDILLADLSVSVNG